MQHFDYKPHGVCPMNISFDLDGDTVHNVSFKGGCNGNLQAISRVVEGMTVEQMVDTALTGFEVEKLEEIPVHYACTCSREKYYNALATLEPDEIDTLPAVDGQVEAVCPYCCRKYYFTKEELHELAENVREKRKNVSK